MSDIRLVRIATPDVPGAGRAKLYVNAAGELELVLEDGLVRTFLYDFSADTLAVLLNGLSLANGTAITSTDTIIQAFGKLQKQISSVAAFNFALSTTDLTNNSNVIMTSVTDLSIPVIAGKSYVIKCNLVYTSPITTTGIGVGVTSTGGAAGALALSASIISNAASPTVDAINAFNTPVVSPSVKATNIPQIAEIRGIFTCTVSGTFTPQFRSEVNGSTITLKAGSTIEYKEY